MFALYKLQAKSYFLNTFNKISFFTSIMFLGVMGSIIVFNMSGNWDDGFYQTKISYLNMSIISSIVLMMVMNASLDAFGFSFLEMKKSVLLKRIGATKISKFEAVGSFLLWGFTSMLLTVGWMSIWIGICQISEVGKFTNGMLYVSPEIWETANFGGMILAIIITTFAFYAISFFFVSISKNAEMYEIITTFYFFFAALLGGSLTPNANREWMTTISYMSPLGWGTQLMTNSSLEGVNNYALEEANCINESASVFNWADGYYILDIDNTSIKDGSILYKFTHVESLIAIGSIVLPTIYGTAAGISSVKFFRWD